MARTRRPEPRPEGREGESGGRRPRGGAGRGGMASGQQAGERRATPETKDAGRSTLEPPSFQLATWRVCHLALMYASSPRGATRRDGGDKGCASFLEGPGVGT